MKLFIAFALFAVASASVLPPAVVANEDPELQQIIAAIQSPSTDPATAAALEQMLLELLGLSKPEPIEVGPAIVEGNEPISIGPAIVEGNEPISIGPALIDFPLPDEAVSEVQPAPVQPAPVAPSASAPLVQIILNVNAGSNIAGAPVAIESNPSDAIPRPEPIPQPIPTPVQVVEEAMNPEPVIVVENPIIPEPIINLPDILN